MLAATARVMADFLRIDTETGLTFSGIALYTDSLQKRERTIREARKAFDTVIRLRRLVVLPESDSEVLERKLHRLKTELESLGQNF